MSDLDQDVVKAVFAPKSVAWFIGRALKVTVVAPVNRLFTPGVGRTDAADGQQCARAEQAVGPPPKAHWAISTARGRTVALEFIRPYA